jgi:hypothetical protein
MFWRHFWTKDAKRSKLEIIGRFYLQSMFCAERELLIILAPSWMKYRSIKNQPFLISLHQSFSRVTYWGFLRTYISTCICRHDTSTWMHVYLWMLVHVHVHWIWMNLFKWLTHDFFVEYRQKLVVWLIWKYLFQVLISVKSHTH